MKKERQAKDTMLFGWVPNRTPVRQTTRRGISVKRSHLGLTTPWDRLVDRELDPWDCPVSETASDGSVFWYFRLDDGMYQWAHVKSN